MPADDFWARKRREEEREEREQEEAKERARLDAKSSQYVGRPETDSEPDAALDTLDGMLKQVPTMIEQLNHLYNQFASGTLATPPRELRARLENLMQKLTNEQKPTPASRFRYQSARESYDSHCLRWDRLIHDLESGKIKRFSGPLGARSKAHWRPS